MWMFQIEHSILFYFNFLLCYHCLQLHYVNRYTLCSKGVLFDVDCCHQMCIKTLRPCPQTLPPLACVLHVGLAFSYIRIKRLFSPGESRVTVSCLRAVITLELFSPHFWTSCWFIGLEVNYAAHHIVRERPFIHRSLSLSHLSNGIDYAFLLSSRRGDSVTFPAIPLAVLLFSPIAL